MDNEQFYKKQRHRVLSDFPKERRHYAIHRS
jgi:hypothetical protein